MLKASSRHVLKTSSRRLEDQQKFTGIALEQIKAGLTSENDWKPTIRIYVNKIETRITFKVKSGYYLKCLTPETVKLLGSTKDQITENKTDENVLYLKLYWSSFSPLRYC